MSVLFPISLLGLLLAGCLREGPILDPGSHESRPSLGRFQGRSQNEGDTAFSSKRYGGLTNPKVAMVWQFIGPKEFTYSTSDGLVKDANIPFNFVFDMVNPPDKDILESQDLALGTFWLYQDANGNGKLDRLIHPELLDMNLKVDRVYGDYLEAMDSVLEVSRILPVREDVVETYYIGRYGTTVRMVDGKPDTIWAAPGPQLLDQKPWLSILNNRFHVLNFPNRWERFFSLRGRSNDYYRIQVPAEGFAFAYEFPYERKLYPLPGKEAEFEARVRDATWKLIYFTAEYIAMRGDAMARGLVDYPFDGFGEAGQDWVAGRTRNYSLLYLRNQAALDELFAAEKWSSFSVVDKAKVHLGYNLVWCGDQYECKVLDPSDSIRIDLGMNEAYFNPPSKPAANPIAVPMAAEVLESRLERLKGAYRFQPFHPFSLEAIGGGLWASIPDVGTFRFVAADSIHFFSHAADMQIQIVEVDGAIEKLLFYRAGKRYVATRDSAAEIPEEADARIRTASGRNPVAASASSLEQFGGGYDFAGDTLSIDSATEGDSLRVSMPGFHPQFFLAEEDGFFFSRDCDCRLSFRKNEKGTVTDAVVEREGASVLAPSLSYTGRKPADLFPGTGGDPDSVASSSEGGAPETFLWVDGKGRYRGSGDARYLRPGDGWVESLDHSLPGDSISLSRGGEGIVFRIPGMKGSRAGLELLIRRDVNAGKGRARFRLRGGTDPDRQEILLADDFWADFNGDSATVSIGGWEVESDPYFIRMERVSTPYPDFPVAFDAYRWLADSRGNVADP